MAEQVVPPLLRHTRCPLTLKGRPPFHLAGIGTLSAPPGGITLAAERLVHPHNVHLARLHASPRAPLLPFATEHQELQEGTARVREIDSILPPNLPPETQKN